MLGYTDIKGWFTPNEAMALYDVAQDLPRESPIVCEIGSWQGKSSIVIAKGLIKKIILNYIVSILLMDLAINDR